MSAYGLLDDAARAASGGALGRYVDVAERRTAATRLYALQHACVALSCAAAALAFHTTGGARAFLATLVIAAGSLGGVGASGSSLSVEREWTKALCGDDADALATLNARMRAVDLSCLLLAPIGAAALLQFAGPVVGVLCFAVYNAVAYWPECRLLAAAQHAAPALQQPRVTAQPQPSAAPAPEVTAPASPLNGLRDAWAVYASQPVFPAAFALALLYLTVLSLGFLMTAYLHWRGVSDVTISIFRAFGAATGLAATVAFPPAARRVPLPTLGAAAIAFQLAWLLIGVLPTALSAAPSTPLLRLLMAGIALSRFGLWATDLACSQLLQDGVAPEQLGTVNGVQGALCAALEMCSFLAGLLVHRYERFNVLMLASCVSVATATAILARFAWTHAARLDGAPNTEEDAGAEQMHLLAPELDPPLPPPLPEQVALS